MIKMKKLEYGSRSNEITGNPYDRTSYYGIESI
jgi:hypothetical protein